jgi:uncharacterized protein
MNKEEFQRIESFMLECMNDAVHDCLHSYRVLNYAVQIADAAENVNMEVVIISALLHDIGRAEEIKNPSLCHAEVGSTKVREFLLDIGYSEEKAQHAADCILTHRYGSNRVPQSLEAKILFDADKLDLTGAVGVARAIMFGSQIGEPLYILGEDKLPAEGLPTEEASLFREYNRKLNSLYHTLNTAKAIEIGKEQQRTMDSYFKSLFEEVNKNHAGAKQILDRVLR